MRSMLAKLAVVFAALALLACAHGAAVTLPEASAMTVDTRSVLRLVGGAGMTVSAHAAPVTSTLALTAGHVCIALKDEPADQGMRMLRFSTEDGNEGVVECVRYWFEADLALVRIVGEGARWRAYPIAQEEPQLGEILTTVGYDWRDEKRAYEKRLWEGALLRTLAGFLIHKTPPDPGASGGPVFNAKGEVVGIVSAARLLINQRWIAQSVGIWGKWMAQERLNAE